MAVLSSFPVKIAMPVVHVLQGGCLNRSTVSKARPEAISKQPLTQVNSLTYPTASDRGQLALDDSWSGANQNYQVLATTNGGKEIAIAKRNYGKGMYLITNLRNDTQARTSKNRPMLEKPGLFRCGFSRRIQSTFGAKNGGIQLGTAHHRST